MFGRVVSLHRPYVAQSCASVRMQASCLFSTEGGSGESGIPRLFSDAAIRNLYSLTPEERMKLQSKGALDPHRSMRQTAKQLIEQRLQNEGSRDIDNFQVNPFDRAAEAYNKIAAQGLQHYQNAREQANALSGFNYPGPRFIPKEARPENIEQVHHGIATASIESEDFELAWYRYSRILRRVPDNCKSTFIPFVGISQDLDKEVYDLQKFAFIRDKDTLGMMLHTCLAARGEQFRLHNADIMADAERLLQTYKQEGVLSNLDSKQFELPKSEEKEVKRLTNKKVRKLGNEDEDDNTNEVAGHVDVSEMPVEPEAKLVICEDGVDKVLSGESLTDFYQHLSLLHDRAEAQYNEVVALRRRVRSEVFGELQHAFSELCLWHHRLEYICQDVMDHYKVLQYEANPDLYALLYNNVVAEKTSISGNDAYMPSIGNDLTMLKIVMDAARANGMHVLYCEALTMYMHFNVYLDNPPTVKARKLRLHKKFHSEALEHGNTQEQDYTKYVPSPEQQERIDGVDATMVKVPIVYFGQHTTDVTHLNDFKRLKFVEVSPLCALLRREEVLELSAGLAEVAEAHKQHLESVGMDERLLFLPAQLRETTLLGQGSGIRQVVTSMTVSGIATSLMDGLLIDIARQNEVELPLDYARMVKDSTLVTIREKSAENETSERKQSVFGPLYRMHGSREAKWKTKKNSLTFDKLMDIPVAARMNVLNNEHEGLRHTNLISKVFTEYPSMLEDYIHSSIRSGTRAHLGKALVLWRAATMLQEWTKIRLNNALYADLAKDVDPVQQMQDSKHQREALLADADAEDLDNEDNAEDKKKKLSADLRKRLEGASAASHLTLTTDRMIALLELTQLLAYKKMNFINAGLSPRVHANCYTDELSALWIAAKAMLEQQRAEVPKDQLPPRFSFAITDRSEDELLPFELEFAKVGLMILENMVLEQNIPSAQIFSKQLHTLGLVQKEVLVEFFDGIDSELVL